MSDVTVSMGVTGADALEREVKESDAAFLELAGTFSMARDRLDALEKEVNEQTEALKRLAAAEEQARRSGGQNRREQQDGTRERKRASLAMAQQINLLTETSLGFGALNPRMREATTVLATAGNNAFAFAASMTPVGVALGVAATALPGLISLIVSLTSEMEENEEAASTEARSLRDLASAIAEVNRQRSLQARVEQGLGSFEEQAAQVQELTEGLIPFEQAISRVRSRIGEIEALPLTRRGRDVVRERADLSRELNRLLREQARQEQRIADARAAERQARLDQELEIEAHLAEVADAQNEEIAREQERRDREAQGRGRRGAAAANRAERERLRLIREQRRATQDLGRAILDDVAG